MPILIGYVKTVFSLKVTAGFLCFEISILFEKRRGYLVAVGKKLKISLVAFSHCRTLLQ